MKYCSRCRLNKSLDCFFNDKNRSSGKYPTCKKCFKTLSSGRREQKREYDKKYREVNQEKRKQQSLTWVKNNPEKRKKIVEKYLKTDKYKKALKARLKKYYRINKEIYNTRSKDFYHKNKETLKAKHRDWTKKNIKKVLAYNSTKKKKVRQATPAWANLNAIRHIYENRPKGHHVDHIIPLQGKNVCGLHVPWNLQYLTATENMAKGNRPTSPIMEIQRCLKKFFHWPFFLCLL